MKASEQHLFFLMGIIVGMLKASGVSKEEVLKEAGIAWSASDDQEAARETLQTLEKGLR